MNTSAIDILCPVCKERNFNHFSEVTDYFLSQEKFSLYQCSGCGLILTHPAPEENKISNYYKSVNYISHSDEHESSLMAKCYKLVRSIMLNQKYRWIKKYFNQAGTLLDFGCGTGHFLSYMQQKGWKVAGVEPSELASGYVKKKWGIQTLHPHEFLQTSQEMKFDCITLWHVLEHLDKPEIYIQTFLKILNNDGIICVAVPNPVSWDAKYFKQFWAAWDVPRHLWHFSPDCMVRLFTSHSFRLLDIRRMPFDVFYVSLLSARYKKKHFLINVLYASLMGFFSSLLNKKHCSSLVYIFRKG